MGPQRGSPELKLVTQHCCACWPDGEEDPPRPGTRTGWKEIPALALQELDLWLRVDHKRTAGGSHRFTLIVNTAGHFRIALCCHVLSKGLRHHLLYSFLGSRCIKSRKCNHRKPKKPYKVDLSLQLGLLFARHLERTSMLLLIV